jgi:NAD(P)-dependent dehydrogenase (short-subunit alcohol dehydrogenase family)
MKTNSNNRVALITGANRGIGLQTAKDLGPDGVILLFGVRDLAKGEAAAARMHQEGFAAEAVHLDVTDPVTHRKVCSGGLWLPWAATRRRSTGFGISVLRLIQAPGSTAVPDTSSRPH